MITVDSNSEQVRDSILSIFADIADVDKVLNRATFDSFAMIKQRIQQRGEKSDNSKIGNYQGSSKNPVKTKSGRTITAIAGYAKLRQKLGRQIEYIDLTLTGDMLDRGFSVVKIDESTIVIGFVNDASAEKAKWLEQRFGVIFQNSQEEIKDFIDTVLRDITAIINEG